MGRVVEVELLFAKVPGLACFACKAPLSPYAARHMGQDGTRHHFLLVTCESCGDRSVLAFYVEDPARSFASLASEAKQVLEREQTLRALVARAESAAAPMKR